MKLTHDDIAFLQYTGGTTGVAKGAMLTHGNMVANVLQAGVDQPARFRAIRRRDHRVAAVSHLRADGELPAVRRARLAECAHHDPRDFPAFVKERKYTFTFISGVNTLFNALLHTPGFDKVDFSELRCHARRRHGRAGSRRQAMEGSDRQGADPGLGTHRDFARRVHQLPARTSMGPSACRFRRPRSAFVDDDGNELGINVVGEICVRGPQVMAGYWNRPDETAKVMIGRLAAHR